MQSLTTTCNINDKLGVSYQLKFVLTGHCLRNLVDEFVDTAAPFDEDAGEAAEGTGVGHVRGVRDRHDRVSLDAGTEVV